MVNFKCLFTCSFTSAKYRVTKKTPEQLIFQDFALINSYLFHLAG